MKNITAIFSDDNITVAGITRPAGIYSKILLNEFVDENENFVIEKILNSESRTIESALKSLLIPEKLIETTGITESLIRCLEAVGNLFPFDMNEEWERISILFSARKIENVNILKQSRKERTGNPQALWNTYPQLFDSQFVIGTLNIENEMKNCLMFFENMLHDISIAYSEIRKIADAYSESDKHYEKDLLSEAVGLLKNWNTAELKTEYVPILAENGADTLGRKMIFTSYRDFIIADLFEGIHCGHYTRKCIICGKYFFMTKAYNQQICDGNTNIKKRYEDGFYTCRQYANKIKRKDKAKDDPIKNIYASRCSQLRMSKSRGKITSELYETAVSVAKAHEEKASYDMKYANGQYEKDMTPEAIYVQTERILKNV